MGVVGIVLGLLSLLVGVKCWMLAKTIDREAKATLINNVDPIFKQVNAIAKKLQIDDEANRDSETHDARYLRTALLDIPQKQDINCSLDTDRA